MSQGEGFLFPFLHHHTSLLKGVVGLSFTACIDEQSFIMRIVRAQEINRLRSCLCSGSTGPKWVSCPSLPFSLLE